MIPKSNIEWQEQVNQLEARIAELIESPLMKSARDLYNALWSLSLSVQAHPDYTGEDNDEWTDLVGMAEKALKKARGEA